MKIALVGATGHAGSHILNELLARSHAVTAIARGAAKLQPRPGLVCRAANANDGGALADIFRGHDAVVSAAMFTSAKPETLIAAVTRAGLKRYFVVGGAGTLEVAPGKYVIDIPEIPREYRPEMEAARHMLGLLKQSDLDWTFLSPALDFGPGGRTGQFRLGTDQLLVDKAGRSWISYEDYAIAVADELENPRHVKRRFTIGY